MIAADYNSVLGEKFVFIVDGEQILKNPNQEYKLLLDFFGLNFSWIKFKFNHYKGFYCLEIPIKFCLGGDKGVSRKEKVDLDEKYPGLSQLKRIYKPEMFKIFNYIHNCQTVRKCCTLKVLRFEWTKKYFCSNS